MSDSVDICLLEDCGECIACHLRASQADVSRLSSDVDRLRDERDLWHRRHGHATDALQAGRAHRESLLCREEQESCGRTGLHEKLAIALGDVARLESAIVAHFRAALSAPPGTARGTPAAAENPKAEAGNRRPAIFDEAANAILAARTKYVETVPRVTCHARGRFEGMLEAAGIVRALASPINDLAAAVRDVERDYPLPRCDHGNALRDHAGDTLEPSCGCRAVAVPPVTGEGVS